MKKPYVTLSLVVLSMDQHDIICTSGTTVLATDNTGLWDANW